MAIGNVELMHECFPKLSRIWAVVLWAKISLSKYLRDIESVKTETFKFEVHKFLDLIPAQNAQLCHRSRKQQHPRPANSSDGSRNLPRWWSPRNFIPWVAAQAVRWPCVPKVARSHLSQCSKSYDLQPALNCAIRGAQGVLPCVGWGVRPVNWIYRLWRHCP